MADLSSYLPSLGNVGSNVLGLFGQNAAQQAQMQAIGEAKGSVNNGYDLAQKTTQPIYQTGVQNLQGLSQGYNSGQFQTQAPSTPYNGGSFDPTQIFNDPNYKAQIASGTRTIEGGNEAQGLLFGGKTATDLQTLGEQTAAGSENDLYNQFNQNRSANLQGNAQNFNQNLQANNQNFGQGYDLAGFAPGAASQLSQQQIGQGNAIGNLDLQNGDVRANGILGQTASGQNILGTGGNTAGSQGDLTSYLAMLGIG